MIDEISFVAIRFWIAITQDLVCALTRDDEKTKTTKCFASLPLHNNKQQQQCDYDDSLQSLLIVLVELKKLDE